jgi:hypothetical protein
MIENNNNETRFNLLVNKLGKSPRTISKHLSFLTKEENKILTWEKNAHGKKGVIKFTDKSLIQRKYDFLTIDYTNQKGVCVEWKKNFKIKDSKKRKKKTILFLLLAAAYGYNIHKVTSELQAGFIPINNQQEKPSFISISHQEGFSVEDFREERFNEDFHKKDFRLPGIHGILALNKFTKSEIENMLEELKKNKDIIFNTVIGNDGKVRYIIADSVLKDLLIWCCNILRDFVSMMIQYWFILSKSPKSEERRWFSFIVGEDFAINLFQKIEENRVRKKTIKDLYIEYHFKNLDKEKVDRIVKYKEEYYPNIFTKNGMIDFIFIHSSENTILQNHCKLIAGDYEDEKSNKKYNKDDKMKYQKLINSKKYQWIFEELEDIINPVFSKNKYEVQLH